MRGMRPAAFRMWAGRGGTRPLPAARRPVFPTAIWFVSLGLPVVLVAAFSLLLLFAPLVPPAAAQIPPAVLAHIRYEERPGNRVDPNLVFIDPRGESVRLGDYFGSMPVLLTLTRYRCDRICPELINNVIRALQPLPYQPDVDYRWVVVSLDAEESPFWAGKKMHEYLVRYAHRGGIAGWHFLVGRADMVQALADAVGCRFYSDPRTGVKAEPLALVLLTPGGTVSSYIEGADIDTEDLAERMGLAASGGVRPAEDVASLSQPGGTTPGGSPLVCYPYDPSETARGTRLLRLIRMGSSLNVLALGGLVVWLLLREHRRARRVAGRPGPEGRSAAP